MKIYITICIMFLLMFGVNNASAQRRGRPDNPGPGPGQNHPPGPFNEYRKLRMIESLKLNEEDAARFVTKESAHEETNRKLMTQRNDLLDDIRKGLKENKEPKEFQKSVDQVLDLDQQIFKERQRYQEEIQKFLSPEKFARFLVFEREFGRGVRDVIKDIVHEHWRERGE
ncbi:MAG: hypothetical protein ACHQQQ_07615 [Bacteroidota bacterium]